VALQERYIDGTRRDPSVPLRVGIGLDAGEAQPFEGGYRGRALNLAARLKDMARVGQVLATEALIHLAGQVEGLAYLERGLVRPKGFALPVHIVQVVAEGEQPQEAEDIVEPEFRTFLFADIHGYTAFVARQSDAVAANLEKRYARLMEAGVRPHGGRVLELAGDHALVAFVSPRQAVRAAMDLQEQFQQTMDQKGRLPLTLAIGIEAGEALPMMGKYTGLVIHLAIRICRLAGPGEVLIGETLAHLVRKQEGLTFVDRGQVQVTGFADPVRIRQVVREDAGAQEADVHA